MRKHKSDKNYEVRYGAPWRQGERSRRYYVFQPPRVLSWWWRRTDGIKREYSRFQLFGNMLINALYNLFLFGLGVYVFFWHVLPALTN